MKFILSRTDDRLTHSRKWIVGYSLLFWLVTRMLGVAILMGCCYLYGLAGIDPDKITSFAGMPDLAGIESMSSHLLFIFTIIVGAPLLEEGIFRLGLSFRKWQVALSLAMIPVAVLWHYFLTMSATGYIICLTVAAAVFSAVYFGTSQHTWTTLRERHLVSAMWITSIAFGILHLIAFSALSWMLLPYCLCVILIPFFGGCCCAYLRVNLGFGWGVAMHIFNNLPALLVLLTL